MSDPKRYIYSKTQDTSLRGGTEKIEALLSTQRNFEKISVDDIKKTSGVVLIIGVGLREMLWILLRSRRPISVLKTATYSKKRFFLERAIYFLLYPLVKVTVISKWQAPYYFKSELLNLYELYSNEVTGANLTTSPKRKYKFAYVGRIDYDKGYFEAKKLLLRLSTSNKCLMDLLVWNDADLQHLPERDLKNLDIILGGRDKAAPCFYDISALVLPYRSLDSTIAIPLVLLEACLSGCVVYTTDEIVRLMHDEFPQLRQSISRIRELKK